jgi:hypothetical protein
MVLCTVPVPSGGGIIGRKKNVSTSNGILSGMICLIWVISHAVPAGRVFKPGKQHPLIICIFVEIIHSKTAENEDKTGRKIRGGVKKDPDSFAQGKAKDT